METSTPQSEEEPRAAGSRLQRLRQAIARRDWLGIGIELIVVTLGVLLAFRVDQWGQDQRQAREERQFLERMWRETAIARTESEDIVKAHARAIDQLASALNARNDPAKLARFAATPEYGCMVGFMPGLGFNDTAYQELQASGKLNLVTDPAIRAGLRAIIAAQADAVQQLSYARLQSTSIQQALDRYVFLSLDAEGNRLCRMNWPGLVQDHAAVNAIARSARFHVLVWQRRAVTRDLLLLAHARIACALGKPDCTTTVDLIAPELVEQSGAVTTGQQIRPLPGRRLR